MNKFNNSDTMLNLCDDLTSFIENKSKSKQIVVKYLTNKGYLKQDVNLVLENLQTNNFISFNDSYSIEITKKGKELINSGGFRKQIQIVRAKEIDDLYNNLLKQNEIEKQYELRESTIKVNSSNLVMHKYQKTLFIFNLIVGVINLIILTYNLIHGK